MTCAAALRPAGLGEAHSPLLSLNFSLPQQYRDADFVASLRYLLDHEWTTQAQGVYNVLQHSYMLPTDIRFATLLRGLREKDDIQLRLAAAVGVQFTRGAFLDAAPEADRLFRGILLDYAAAEEEDDFLAARAFLAVRQRLKHPRDTKFVLALLVRMNNETRDRHCLLALAA